MRLIHTADWHLGQSFYDYDRKREHIVFLEWLKKIIEDTNVDLLLISGDIFDSPNPSAQSQQLYYNFLYEVTRDNPRLQIIVIAGNHDSASRLEAPNALLESMNITIRGVVKRNENGQIDFDYLAVPIKVGGYCLAVPYLRQGDYPVSDTYAQGVSSMYKELYNYVKDKQGPIIAMGHLQATGSEISENDDAERKIIGGLESISPDAFNKDILYTALGHLHRRQKVSGRENVRYSGTPLPMSFAEKNNKQGVTLVTINNSVDIDLIEFDAPVKLLSIPNVPLSFDEVIKEIEALPDGELNDNSPYLEIKVHIKEPEPALRHKIETALNGKSVRLARLSSFTNRSEQQGNIISFEELQNINPLDMAIDIFKKNYGGDDMPDNMKNLLLNVLKEIE